MTRPLRTLESNDPPTSGQVSDPASPTADAAPAGGRRISVRAISNTPEFSLFVALLVAVLLFTLLESQFFSVLTVQTVLRAASFVGIVAAAQALLLIGGEFDLSVGAVAGLSALASGELMTSGMAWPLAIVVGLAIGGSFGLLNGLLVTMLGIPALIVTLGTLFIAQGLSLVVTGGFPVRDLPGGFESLGTEIYGVPLAAVVFAVVLVALGVVLRRTVFGRRVFGVGGNVDAAEVAGMRPRRIKILLFVNAGVFSALAGILLIARLGVGDPSLGQAWNLQSIAGAVVGGVSLFGGAGRAVGVLLGVLFLQVIQTGLVIGGVDTSLTRVAVGALLIAAIALDAWRQRRRSFGT